MLDKIKNWRAKGQERRAIEAEMRQAKRLPPGQRVTRKFPIIHIGQVPTFDPATWNFKVWGAVSQRVGFTWAQFQELPRQSLTLDLHCVTQWSKFDTTWEGVSLRTLVDEGIITPNADATHVIQFAEGGYKTNLPLSIALQDNFLLATHFNGQPLDPEHGYPLRGVIGHIIGRDELEDVYLWKGAKWLRGLKFTTKDEPGTWEVGGYHNEGDVWREERWGRRWKN
ncbi:MAG: molybdopterin-dependent oxidoreductase [Anaerolineae bacterium]